MKTLNADELWDFCRGMDWVWDFCSTGTAEGNARGVQRWIEHDGEYTASLKTCRRVAAQIQRHNKDPWGEGVGNALGQNAF